METGEVFEGEAVPVVSAPPEGYKPNWDAFWATAKELGLTREEVHAFWDLPPDEGALKSYVDELATASAQHTVPGLVAEMTTELAAIADAKAEAAKVPPAPTGRLKPRPETTDHAAEIEEARRSFFAAASEMELSTHRSLHKALRLPCKGEGPHDDVGPGCRSLDEHRNMLTMDGRGAAGAWRTLTLILRGEAATPWAEAEPEPEYVGAEEAAQAAFSE